MSIYNIVASTDESTVVAEYVAVYRTAAEYQSEADLEREFIRMLSGQGYEYLAITDEAALINNLRRQLEILNGFIFSKDEWTRFFGECIANSNEGIVEKTRKIQDDHVQVLKRDDGSTKNVYLLDKKNIHNNRLQVINQYTVGDAAIGVPLAGYHTPLRENRYDVTILVNGLPLVHVELKRRGVAIREAFNQIKRYQRDSFWAASGLYEYIQIFVISNGTNTKYYSNTTRNAHIKELGENERRKSKKTSNSFEFTSYLGGREQQGYCRPCGFYKDIFRETHAVEYPDPLLRVYKRGIIARHAPVSDSGDGADFRAHCRFNQL